jgi:hypothetical protein
MATFNAELAVKVLEKRVGTTEKIAQNLATKFDQDDSAAALKKSIQTVSERLDRVAQRLDKVEKMVQALVDTRGDSKVAALEKLVQAKCDNLPDYKAMDKLQSEVDRLKAQAGFDTKRFAETSKVLDEQIKASHQFDKEYKEMQRTLETQMERKMKEAMKEAQDQQTKANKELYEKHSLESEFTQLTKRLNILEKLVTG